MRIRSFAHALRVLRGFLTVDTGERLAPAEFTRAACGILWLARFYYLFTTYSILAHVNFERAIQGNPPTDPLWPVATLMRVAGSEWLDSAALITVAGSAVALLATIFPHVMVCRLAVFIYLFVVIALSNSYGSVNHGNYFYLFVGFPLVFLPSGMHVRLGRMPRRNVMSCIMVFWSVQSTILLSYTLAGYWKVSVSGMELFASDGMLRILLARLMNDTVQVPPLLPLIASQKYLAQWMLLVTVYTQVFAILAVFRPHLHRPFGVVLILSHIGSDLLMNVESFANIVFLGLFLVFSPLAPARLSPTGLLQSLPLFGFPFRRRASTVQLQ